MPAIITIFFLNIIKFISSIFYYFKNMSGDDGVAEVVVEDFQWYGGVQLGQDNAEDMQGILVEDQVCLFKSKIIYIYIYKAIVHSDFH